MKLLNPRSCERCDVCREPYPGQLPTSPSQRFARGWTSAYHPTDSMQDPDALSLLCPSCTSRLLQALGLSPAMVRRELPGDGDS